MRKVAWLAGVVTVLASASYTFVYLYRWEWHRALIAGTLFIAGEVAVSSALVLRRIGKLEAGLQAERERDEALQPAMADRLHRTTPHRDHFAWLEESAGRFGVFIPVLLGSGVVVSAVAWVVERIAGRTVEPAVERGLAHDLAAIAFPRGGLVPDDTEVLVHNGRSEEEEDVALLLGPGFGR